MWIRIQVLNYILQKCQLSIEKTENEWKEAVYGPNYEYFAAICCAWMLNYVLCSVSSAAKTKNAIYCWSNIQLDYLPALWIEVE